MADAMNAYKDETTFQLIQRIPLFSNLSRDYIQLILDRCSEIMLEEEETLCNQGDISDSMYFLIKGKLAVKIKKSAAIATIHPVSTIGELGVFTGEPRSATVLAMEKSMLLNLQKKELDSFIDKYPGVGITIIKNVIREMSQRLRDDNIRLREFQRYVISQEEDKLKQSE